MTYFWLYLKNQRFGSKESNVGITAGFPEAPSVAIIHHVRKIRMLCLLPDFGLFPVLEPAYQTKQERRYETD
jgi:hypothetical protein